MSCTCDASLLALPDTPAFLVGITGHMDLRPEEIGPLKERVRLLFRLLKPVPEDGEDDSNADQRWLADLESLVSLLPDTSGLNGGEDKKQPYRAALAQWPRLKHTPIVVLTSLAPGADSLVAEVALEEPFRQAGFVVVAALPLPPKHYAESTTFVWKKGTYAENEQRKAKFVELMRQIQPGNHFVVHLADDMKLTAADLEDRYRLAATGEACKSERHQRYRAAGEYMAVYSHLMIAIWDHHHDANTDVGTAAIVEARRSGPTAGLLPTTAPLAVPHGGPAIHFYTRRLKNDQPNDTPSMVRFLQAHNIEHDRAADDNNAAWQQQGLALMTRIVVNLDRFNERGPVPSERVKQELCSRLTYRAARDSLECFSGELRAHGAPLYAPLRRLAALRKAASDTNRKMVDASHTTMLWLFFLTILAALALDFFAHWHPQDEHQVNAATLGEQPHAAAPAAVRTPEDGSTSNDSGKMHQWPLLVWFAGWFTQARLGTLAILAACFALLWFWRRRSHHWEDDAQDYRAIAEGARVQFYWHLAGIGQSVSANYMDRQRNELDWIRGAIRAVSFPYEDIRPCFARLPAALQISALRCVLHGWVEDQRLYYKEKSQLYETRLHFWHKVGNVMALAGLGLVLLLAVDAWFHSHLAWLRGWGGTLFWTGVLLAVAWPFGVWFWQGKRKHREAKHAANTAAKTRGEWIVAKTHEYIDLSIPTTSPQRFPQDRCRKLREMLTNFLLHGPTALALTLATLGIVVLFSDHAHNLPDAYNLTIVAVGCLLIVGAMAVAWVEKNLHSELAYQYHTMLSLFENASVRISQQIQRLASIDPANHRPQYDQQLQEIQAAILELGMEALDENAEWLILHRARPLEPVMAG